MTHYKSLLQAHRSTAVVAVSRMNPPTTGHGILVRAVNALAEQRNADSWFFLSSEQDAQKNPLTLQQKLYYAKQAFPGTNFIGTADADPLHLASTLDEDYQHLIIVTTKDQVLKMKQSLDESNGSTYSFKSILVVGVADRDPDTSPLSLKARQAVQEGSLDVFRQVVPSLQPAHMVALFEDMRSGMHLLEDVDRVRDDYINHRIFNVGEVVEHKGVEEAIKIRGPNYVILESGARAWIKDVRQTGKVNEAIMNKQADKLRAARIIGMSLGYTDAESKTDPSLIVNNALRAVRNKPLNDESKGIITRMLHLATQMDIKYDDTLLGLTTPESNYSKLRKVQLQAHESVEEEDDVDEEEFLRGISDEDIIEHGYDDDEFHVVDDESGEVREEFDLAPLQEVLSRVERMRAKVRMRRSEAKRERAERIALKKRSSSKVLAKRARRIAVKTLELKLARKPLKSLSVTEKERLEARIARLKPVITRIAAKMLPRVRQVERDRLTHASTQKE